jgi:hypothetical protein
MLHCCKIYLCIFSLSHWETNCVPFVLECERTKKEKKNDAKTEKKNKNYGLQSYYRHAVEYTECHSANCRNHGEPGMMSFSFKCLPEFLGAMNVGRNLPVSWHMRNTWSNTYLTTSGLSSVNTVLEGLRVKENFRLIREFIFQMIRNLFLSAIYVERSKLWHDTPQTFNQMLHLT